MHENRKAELASGSETDVRTKINFIGNEKKTIKVDLLKDEIELRSEEVQEILTKVPGWFISWGNTLFLALIILILSICWFVSYPDVVDADAYITTHNPPQKEVARVSGKFDTIFVDNYQLTKKNSVLAVLENSAKTADVYFLKSILETVVISDREVVFPINEIPILLLGDIELAYGDFETSYVEFQLNKSLKPFNNEAIANKVSLVELRIRLENMQAQFVLFLSELSMKKNDLSRHKLLLDKGVISMLQYENKQLEVLNTQKAVKNIEVSISQTREAISNADRALKGNDITRTMEETKLLHNVLQSYNQLKKSIKDWENLYVFKSEIDGKVSFLNYWSSNQTVNQGDLVFTIIPIAYGGYTAKIRAAPQNSGKIKTGQKVNIKLKNYPETEFGILRGEVTSISLSPDNDGNYLIDAALPENLLTSYKKKIEFKQEMSGTAEIITEELRLLERFFYQFKSLFDN